VLDEAIEQSEGEIGPLACVGWADSHSLPAMIRKSHRGEVVARPGVADTEGKFN
jgi:hypothetical protein